MAVTGKQIKAAGKVFDEYFKRFGLIHFNARHVSNEWRVKMAKRMLAALEAGEPIGDDELIKLIPQAPDGILV